MKTKLLLIFLYLYLYHRYTLCQNQLNFVVIILIFTNVFPMLILFIYFKHLYILFICLQGDSAQKVVNKVVDQYPMDQPKQMLLLEKVSKEVQRITMSGRQVGLYICLSSICVFLSYMLCIFFNTLIFLMKQFYLLTSTYLYIL